MTEAGAVWPDDLAAVNTTDALLDDLAAGLPAGDRASADDRLTELLASWRAELDDRAASVMTIASSAVPVPPAARPVRWARAHRRTAAVTALAVALAASTGVAAAESGPTGPLGGLHKLFFGDRPPPHHVDVLAIDVQKLLTTASRQINAAAQTGSIGTAMRGQIASTLDQAERLLQQDALAPQSLLDELHNLRTALVGIPDTAPPATSTDDHGDGHSGSDDNTSGDRHGGGGDDNSTENTNNSNVSGSDDGGTQGSDGGSGSDSLQSGDGGGDSQSGDGGDGGGGGDSQSGSSNDGSGSDGSNGSGD